MHKLITCLTNNQKHLLIAKTSFDDLDKPLLERMKIRLADSLGATAAGVYGVGTEMVLRMLREYGGKEEASVYNFGDKMPARHAVFLNSLQMRWLGMGHC